MHADSPINLKVHIFGTASGGSSSGFLVVQCNEESVSLFPKIN